MRGTDVLVVGGGAIGCAIAHALAVEGVSVRLLERTDLASGASGAAAGMLAPICESEGEGPLFTLGVRSLELFPQLACRLRELSGIDPQYVRSGVLRVAAGPAEASGLQGRASHLAHYGLEWLDARAAAELEPRLGPETHGALWSPREAHVLSPLLTQAFLGAASRLGAIHEIGVPVTDLLWSGDRVLGVQTPLGPRHAGVTVLCAGAWIRFCAPRLNARIPVEPVRGQILALDAPCPAPRSIVWGEGAYLVPKLDGRLIVGATEERVGYDCRTTAEGVQTLLQAAVRLLPALADCRFRQAWAGLRPDTPDHLPGIGPMPGCEGLLVAAGHYRNGVLLSPVTARIVDDLVHGREPWPEAAALRLDRWIASIENV